MSGPYRDAEHVLCPACGEAMRAYYKRLCCDACTGIFVAFDDLARAIEDHASAPPKLGFRDIALGDRACPRCRARMTTCRLAAMFGAPEHATLPAPVLDRCATHGVWFDAGELAKILQASRLATEPGDSAGAFARALVELWESGR